MNRTHSPKEERDEKVWSWFVVIIILIIITLCSSGNSQDCDKFYEFTKEKASDKIMSVTPIIKGAYECVNIGTNLYTVKDTVLFVILVQKNGEEAELFGIYELCPNGTRNIIPTLYTVIDERIIVGVSSNAPVGTEFYMCLKELGSYFQKALFHNNP